MTQIKSGPGVADTAILLATQRGMPATQGGLGIPLMLLPLQGRCFLQRAVELLVRAGCKRIHVAIGDNAKAVRDFLQSGERWGARLDYHYLGSDEALARFSYRLGLDPDCGYWLADATRLPSAALPALGRAEVPAVASEPLCWNDMTSWRWTGWGHFSGAWLMTCRYPLEQAETEQCVLRGSQLLRHQVARPLSVASLAGLLDSNRRLLAGRQSLPTAFGRGTEIHPGARIIAPVHIGAGVKVAAGAVIGPNVSIEDGCFVDGGSRLEDSLVLTGTYVGRELNLQGIITNGHLLANMALDTVAEISDPNLLSGPAVRVLRVPPGERLLARVLYHGLQPLRWVARWQMADRSATGERAVAIPVPCVGGSEPSRAHVALHLPPAPSKATPQQWKEHFCRTFHPGLRQVMQGRLQLVGPTLRSEADVRRLPAAWRRLYAGFRCGLLNDGLVQDPTTSTSDERFAEDAVACANQGDMRAGWKLLRPYLAKVMRDLFVARTRKTDPLPQLPMRVAD